MCWPVYLFLLQRYKLFLKPPNFFTLIYIYSKRKSSHQPSLMAVICPLPSSRVVDAIGTTARRLWNDRKSTWYLTYTSAFFPQPSAFSMISLVPVPGVTIKVFALFFCRFSFSSYLCTEASRAVPERVTRQPSLETTVVSTMRKHL